MKQWWTWAKSGRGQSSNSATGPKDGKGQHKSGNKKRLGTTSTADTVKLAEGVGPNSNTPGVSAQTSNGSDTSNSSTPGVKKRLGGGVEKDNSVQNKEVLCADGQATVAGLSGHYICDGGCDRDH